MAIHSMSWLLHLRLNNQLTAALVGCWLPAAEESKIYQMRM